MSIVSFKEKYYGRINQIGKGGINSIIFNSINPIDLSGLEKGMIKSYCKMKNSLLSVKEKELQKKNLNLNKLLFHPLKKEDIIYNLNLFEKAKSNINYNKANKLVNINIKSKSSLVNLPIIPLTGKVVDNK